MRTVVGVMGSGRPLSVDAHALAYETGAMIAERGWVLLTGGTAAGVMDAASRGAHEAGGLVIGVLKSDSGAEASKHIDVAIRTGMGDARNAINVLSSDVVIALPGSTGTISEVALALKAGKTVVALGWDPGRTIREAAAGQLVEAATPAEAIAIVAATLARHHH